MSDDSGRLSFLRTRTLGERLREGRPWATNRRSVSVEKESTPILTVEDDDITTRKHSLTLAEPSTSPTGSGDGGVGGEPGSRLSRLFSITRRTSDSQGESRPDGRIDGRMHPLAEEEEAVLRQSGPMAAPPSLPPAPLLMSSDQTKRRFIMNSLVQSENNYLDSLSRLVQDYKKPLEESNPPILPENKVETMFYRVPQILECHSQFRIALSEAVKNWDEEEKIGDVFVASFSKSVVLEVYSDFINNFSEAMELAKCESKRKSAFADFLKRGVEKMFGSGDDCKSKVKQITAHDRLNFFGLMVKPIQRFPQFILLLQDLLKETPPGHGDRMALQLALTTLESLAEMLNERKRECEQTAAFHEKLRAVGGKIGKTEGTRMLLREDDVQRLEFNSAGQVSRTKTRRLLLLNDRVVCVTVTGRNTEQDSLHSSPAERLSFKWSAHVSEVEVVEGASTGTLARMVSQTGGLLAGVTKKASLTKTSSSNNNSVDKQMAENLAQDMSDLMHDFDVVSRINSMVGSLRCTYPGLTGDCMAAIMDQIQKSIRQKDDEMSWLDKSCLQLVVKRKDKTETLTFQMRSPAVKQDWVVELRLARLGLDPNNSPGWDILEQSKHITTRLPLYVKHLSAYHHPEGKNTEVVNGTSYTLLVPTPTRTLRPVTYVWANATDTVSSHIKIYSVQVNQQIALKDLGTTVLSSCCARSIVFVPGTSGGVAQSNSDNPLRCDLVWVATDDRRILLYAAADPERGSEVGRIMLPAAPLCQVYHCSKVFVGLVSGVIHVFRRDHTVNWDLNTPTTITIGTEPVTCLLPTSGNLYTASGQRIHMLDAWNNSISKSFTANGEHAEAASFKSSVMSLVPGATPLVSHMAVCGIGLWVSLDHSSTVSLYHTESFIHMQDINIASNVSRALGGSSNKRSIYVTALSAAKGLLWVGTNVGIALTIPLPRLEGVPIISGKANISYHAHFGPVRMFLPLQPKVHVSEPIGGRPRHQTILEEPHSSSPRTPKHQYKKQMSEGVIPSPHSTPPMNKQLVRSRSAVSSKETLQRKNSKTLPRGFTIGPGSESSGESVFGLYGDLMNVGGYEVESRTSLLEGSSQNLRSSDPELDTIPYRVGTLDRRVAMKSQRPRSLDLSSWSMHSGASTHTTSSSGEGGSQKSSPSVSRTASCASDTRSDSNTSDSSWTIPNHGVTTPATNLKKENTTLTRDITSPTSKENKESTKSKAEMVQRTVTTLMGGRGYIQWRATHLEKDRKASSLQQINNSDACLVIWDHKL